MEYSAATIIYIPLANWGEGLEVFRKGELDKRAQHQKIGFYDYITPAITIPNFGKHQKLY